MQHSLSLIYMVYTNTGPALLSRYFESVRSSGLSEDQQREVQTIETSPKFLGWNGLALDLSFMEHLELHHRLKHETDETGTRPPYIELPSSKHLVTLLKLRKAAAELQDETERYRCRRQELLQKILTLQKELEA